jgi:hypothetical protein
LKNKIADGIASEKRQKLCKLKNSRLKKLVNKFHGFPNSLFVK